MHLTPLQTKFLARPLCGVGDNGNIPAAPVDAPEDFGISAGFSLKPDFVPTLASILLSGPAADNDVSTRASTARGGSRPGTRGLRPGTRGSRPGTRGLTPGTTPAGSRFTPSAPQVEVQSSDLRGYSDLDSILGSQWQHPSELVDAARAGTATSWKLPAVDRNLFGTSQPSSPGASPRLLKSGTCQFPDAGDAAEADVSEPMFSRSPRHDGVNLSSKEQSRADAVRRAREPAETAEVERPKSPLRPGSYVTHERQYRTRIRARNLRRLDGSRPGVDRDSGTQNVKDGRKYESKSPKKIVRNEMLLPGQFHVLAEESHQDKLEDHISKADQEKYEKWKRQVVECARNLKEEVDRFRFPEAPQQLGKRYAKV